MLFLVQGMSNLLTRDRGSTRSASACRWGGNKFESWHRVITKDVEMVPIATMSGARH